METKLVFPDHIDNTTTKEDLTFIFDIPDNGETLKQVITRILYMVYIYRSRRLLDGQGNMSKEGRDIAILPYGVDEYTDHLVENALVENRNYITTLFRICYQLRNEFLGGGLVVLQPDLLQLVIQVTRKLDQVFEKENFFEQVVSKTDRRRIDLLLQLHDKLPFLNSEPIRIEDTLAF